MTPYSNGRLALRGSILHFLQDPAHAHGAGAWQYFEDGVLHIDNGAVTQVHAWSDDLLAQLPQPQLHDWRGKLILPGMVDCHIHSAQMQVIASYGLQLLDWLERYTYPAELRFADAAHSEAAAELFTDTLLAHGTTCAAVFPTVHPTSVDALFTAAAGRDMRMLAGKVMMNRHAPEALCDSSDMGERDCCELVERWHGKHRLSYVMTPRFVPTSTEAQLQMMGELCAAYGLAVQSHVAENRAEGQWVQELFPAARSYAAVYEHFGLLRPGSVYAHGVWLDDEDRRLMAERQTAIAFCPSSNLFMGSGLFDLRKATEAGVTVGLATDVGGGTTYSLLQTMAEAYKVLQLRGQSLSAWRAFYLATLGGAKALGQDRFIGNFQAGKEADVVVLDWAIDDVQRARLDMADGTEDQLFALMMLGHQRNVAATYVRGLLRYQRS